MVLISSNVIDFWILKNVEPGLDLPLHNAKPLQTAVDQRYPSWQEHSAVLKKLLWQKCQSFTRHIYKFLDNDQWASPTSFVGQSWHVGRQLNRPNIGALTKENQRRWKRQSEQESLELFSSEINCFLFFSVDAVKAN